MSKLDRVKGADSRASNIVSYYPRYIDDFNAVARWLRKMKEVQFQANGVADVNGRSIPMNCGNQVGG